MSKASALQCKGMAAFTAYYFKCCLSAHPNFAAIHHTGKAGQITTASHFGWN
jgi:hypothetical protein